MPSSPTLLALPDIADLLNAPVTRVHQLLRDGSLVSVRVDGVRRIPAEFVADGAVVKGLPGAITLLGDAGYGADEVVEWLFRTEPALGPAGASSTAIEELRAGRIREVHRRAQAAGF